MKKKILNLIIALFLFCSGGLMAQNYPTLSEVVKKTPEQALPIGGWRFVDFIYEVGYCIDNKDNALFNKVYKNAQLTDYFFIGEGDEEAHRLFRKFAIPNSQNKLLIVAMEVVENYTDILVTVTPDGKVLDQMYGEIGLFPFRIRECRISKDGKVFTYQLKTTESSSIDFLTFKQFCGYREDHVYKITPEGKFKEVGSRRYQPRVYTRDAISDRNYHIWNGQEVRVAE